MIVDIPFNSTTPGEKIFVRVDTVKQPTYGDGDWFIIQFKNQGLYDLVNQHPANFAVYREYKNEEATCKFGSYFMIEEGDSYPTNDVKHALYLLYGIEADEITLIATFEGALQVRAEAYLRHLIRKGEAILIKE